MTRPMDDFLSRVNNAEPDAGQWAAFESRMQAQLESPMPADLQRAEAAAHSPPATQPLLARSSRASNWVGGGIAAGLALAGIALFGLRGVAPQATDGIVVAGEQQADVAAVDVASARLTSAANGLSSPANELAQQDGPASASLQSTPNSVRADVRRPRKADAAKRGATASPTMGASGERSVEPAPQAPLGESDVEYDRRHLVPIDAALQAQQPQTALKLLAAFQPKTLTNYAAGLRAIALCDAGQGAQGKSLAERTLPQLGHRGLVRRVEVACGLKAPSEIKP